MQKKKKKERFGKFLTVCMVHLGNSSLEGCQQSSAQHGGKGEAWKGQNS